MQAFLISIVFIFALHFGASVYLFPVKITESGELFVPSTKKGGSVYPAWAHSHWVWLSSDQANQKSEIEFVQGFLDRDIPVGAVDIDSQWSTGDNNFIMDTNKYPNVSEMIQHFHSLNVKVIFWVTSMINTDSSNYQEGFSKGYYLNWGETVKWWHGKGSFLDYSNPDAVDWWHKQMDNLLDLGMDGWKTDGTDPFVFELIVAFGKSGVISEREYANYYYRDFYYYSRTKNPEALIMARPVDSYKEIYLEFAPRDVVFSGWVGDQDPTFDGLQNALRNIFHSAWNNYVNFGSDIGGYRTGPGTLGRTKELFIRWFQMGAFTPLMENGGNKEHRPWMFDNNNETLNIYRTFVYIHLELGPYLLNAGTEAYNSGKSVIFPQASDTIFTPDSWSYQLWTDIFVAPIVQSGVTTWDVTFPADNNWVDWWDHSKIYEGGSKISYNVSNWAFPVFRRQFSMMALNITSNNSYFGNKDSSGSLTLLINQFDPTGKVHSTTVREFDARPEEKSKVLAQEFAYHYENSTLYFQATSYERNLIILLRGVTSDCGLSNCFKVTNLLNGTPFVMAKSEELLLSYNRKSQFSRKQYGGQYCISQNNDVWIATGPTNNGAYLAIEGIINSV